jgi:hypothetical protein
MNPTNERATVHGPYDTSGDALRDAAHVYDASRRQERRGTMGQVAEGLLLAALASAGVQLGQYEREIAGWLAGYEPETVLVVIGWIERARAGQGAEADQVPGPAGPDLIATLDAAMIRALDLSLETADRGQRAQIGEWVASARVAMAAKDTAAIRRLLAQPYVRPAAPDPAGFPWQVWAQPQGGARWLVNAFATRELAERFTGRHSGEYGPLTIEPAEPVHWAIEGGPACRTRRFFESMTRATSDVTCDACRALIPERGAQ